MRPRLQDCPRRPLGVRGRNGFARRRPVHQQAKIVKWLELKAQGRSMNAELRKSKGYRNPTFLQRIVDHYEIEELRSHFSPDVFDPYNYDKADYYNQLGASRRVASKIISSRDDAAAFALGRRQI